MVAPPLSEVEISLLSDFHSEEIIPKYDEEPDGNGVCSKNGNLDEEDAESVNSLELDVAGKLNLNMMGIKNIFDVNDDAFQKAVAKRFLTITEEKAWERVIEQSVGYFKGKMERKMAVLKERNETRTEQVSRAELDHEVMVQESRLRYIIDD